MKSLLSLVLLIIIAASVSAGDLRPFASDGCSSFPDGTINQKNLWLNCCTEHDKAYWAGGTRKDRKKADAELKQCVKNVGEPEIAQLMLAGVRVGGTPYLPTTFRWGYGWPYPRGYKALTAEEKAEVIAERRKIPPSGFAGHAPITLLSQDLNDLSGSDGRLVEAQAVNLQSAWSDKTEAYRIRYTSDGLEVVGFVVKPKAADVKFPAIIFNRGGNREYGKVTEGMLKHLSFLSAQGYVVLASQYRGNDGGEGQEDFGGKDVNDVLNIIALARSLPFVDPTKIVMLGYSRGGMMTYLAIKHGADIQAAVVVGGISDLEQLYRDREEGMKDVIRELVGMEHADWEARSAIYWPENIDVPILILHGEGDRRVHVSQAKRLATKLREANSAHELVLFPEGDHGLKTHRSERNRYIFDWFEKYLND